MATLRQAKMLGGIGSILTILLFVPHSVGAGLVIVGWVLTILAVKYISDVLRDRSIFNNAIIAVVLAIAGVVVFAVVVAGAILGFIGLGGGISPPSMNSTSFANSGMVGLIAGVLGGLAIVWVLAIVSAYFLRRSYNTIAAGLNAGLFRTGALIYLIGAILTIIGVGFVLIFVAQILFVVAFFTLPDNPPTVPAVQPQPVAPTPPPRTAVG
jgi:uncharacterized membrane protein